MSKPQFPQTPDLNRQDAINQVISSIASEELALSHVINTEGEKIQYAVGTIPGLTEGATIAEAIDVNDSVIDTLGSVLENQIVLTGKLTQALQAPVFYGASGPAGPMGPPGPDIGPAGASGPTGPAGAAAPTPPPSATAGFAANTEGGLITVLVAGSDISFPNVQLLSPDITLTSGSTVFTVNTAGIYRISYHVNTTAAVLLGTRLVINSGVVIQSRIPPALTLSQLYNEIQVSLPANATIKLQMYAPLIVGAATLLGGSLGASMMIIRLG